MCESSCNFNGSPIDVLLFGLGQTAMMILELENRHGAYGIIVPSCPITVMQ